jgi:hypothetical protein
LCANFTARLNPFFIHLPDFILKSGATLRKFALYLREYALDLFFFGITWLSPGTSGAESIGMPPSNVRYSSIVIRTSTIFIVSWSNLLQQFLMRSVLPLQKELHFLFEEKLIVLFEQVYDHLQMNIPWY